MIDFKEKNNKKLLIATGLVNKTSKFYIDLDNKSNVNSHLLIAGGSGTGKTTMLKKIIQYLQAQQKMVVIIDFHGDMEVEGENTIKFTPSNSKNAINPFELEKDSEKGGVKIQAEAIRTMLGTYFFDKGRISKKQENALEKLIEATYNAKGIFQDDEKTWDLEIPTMRDLYSVFKYILSCGNKTEQGGAVKLSTDDCFSTLSDVLNGYVKMGKAKEEAIENIGNLRKIEDFIKLHSEKREETNGNQ